MGLLFLIHTWQITINAKLSRVQRKFLKCARIYYLYLISLSDRRTQANLFFSIQLINSLIDAGNTNYLSIRMHFLDYFVWPMSELYSFILILRLSFKLKLFFGIIFVINSLLFFACFRLLLIIILFIELVRLDII